MIWVLAIALALAACDGGGDSRCGPSEGVAARAIDGDTIQLESGETVRYLLVDTPESTGGATDCFGENAHRFNEDLVVGKTVSLVYDVECEDRFGRLLAYVSVGDREVNTLLVERGYACVLHIPPNGDARLQEFEELELRARTLGRGLWTACSPIPC